MNTSSATPKNSKVRPVTVAIPEDLLRRVRILCASRDQTLGAFFSSLCEQAVSVLPDELADLMPVTSSVPCDSQEEAA